MTAFVNWLAAGHHWLELCSLLACMAAVVLVRWAVVANGTPGRVREFVRELEHGGRPAPRPANLGLAASMAATADALEATQVLNPPVYVPEYGPPRRPDAALHELERHVESVPVQTCEGLPVFPTKYAQVRWDAEFTLWETELTGIIESAYTACGIAPPWVDCLECEE